MGKTGIWRVLPREVASLAKFNTQDSWRQRQRVHNELVSALSEAERAARTKNGMVLVAVLVRGKKRAGQTAGRGTA